MAGKPTRRETPAHRSSMEESLPTGGMSASWQVASPTRREAGPASGGSPEPIRAFYYSAGRGRCLKIQAAMGQSFFGAARARAYAVPVVCRGLLRHHSQGTTRRHDFSLVGRNYHETFLLCRRRHFCPGHLRQRAFGFAVLVARWSAKYPNLDLSDSFRAGPVQRPRGPWDSLSDDHLFSGHRSLGQGSVPRIPIPGRSLAATEHATSAAATRPLPSSRWC